MLLVLAFFWFHSQFLSNSSDQLSPGHLCRDLKGNMSEFALPYNTAPDRSALVSVSLRLAPRAASLTQLCSLRSLLLPDTALTGFTLLMCVSNLTLCLFCLGHQDDNDS